MGSTHQSGGRGGDRPGRPLNPLIGSARAHPLKRRRGGRSVLVLFGVLVGLICVSSVALAASAGFASTGDLYDYVTRSLPPVDQIFAKSEFQTALIYDRKGRLLYEMYDPQGGPRTLVHLRDIPPTLVAATLSREDVNFYSNPGIDPLSILRAVGQNILHGRFESGASTITQQLVRNVLMTPEERQSRSLTRKLEEVILAFRVDQRYTKDEILERYLNEISYGNLS